MDKADRISLGPTAADLVARARADLRIGVPVVLSGGQAGVVALAAETLIPARLSAIKALGAPVLAITDWRAKTLKARAYDGDLARIALPDAADAAWIQGVTDPATDLSQPMLGPFRTLRDGDAGLHRTAIRLAKSARLLPAAVVAEVDDPTGLAREAGLTFLPAELADTTLAGPSGKSATRMSRHPEAVLR